MEDNFGGKY